MFWYMVFAVICAYIVKGMSGFANTLVFTTVLGFRANNINISPVDLLLGYPANMVILYRERKSIDYKQALFLSLLVVAGNIPGAFILKMGDTRIIKIIFGLVVVFIGVMMLLKERQKKVEERNVFKMVFFGLISGILCGMFGVSALIAAYVGSTTKDSNEFKGTLCFVFAIENTFRVILYAVTGIFTMQSLYTTVGLLPFAFAALWVGIQIGKKMNEKMAKRVVNVLLILSGLALTITTILG